MGNRAPRPTPHCSTAYTAPTASATQNPSTSARLAPMTPKSLRSLHPSTWTRSVAATAASVADRRTHWNTASSVARYSVTSACRRACTLIATPPARQFNRPMRTPVTNRTGAKTTMAPACTMLSTASHAKKALGSLCPSLTVPILLHSFPLRQALPPASLRRWDTDLVLLHPPGRNRAAQSA